LPRVVHTRMTWCCIQKLCTSHDNTIPGPGVEDARKRATYLYYIPYLLLKPDHAILLWQNEYLTHHGDTLAGSSQGEKLTDLENISVELTKVPEVRDQI
jgi:hypothetical protein